MRILYAVQCTGNGHIARAQEILPILKTFGHVDVLTSGHQAQIEIGHEVKFKTSGVSLIYDKSGAVSHWKTAIQNNYFRAIKAALNFPFKDYDLVINDFEPISAWGCKLKNIPCYELSHQASLLFDETPKPDKKDRLGEMVLKYYSPSSHKIGFHFKSYTQGIYPPVIRSKIKNLSPSKNGSYVVYLPSFQDDVISKTLTSIDVPWVVFSKYTKSSYQNKNVQFHPISEELFLNEFANAQGILCSAGFETPSETLYFGKKLMVIPIAKQFEQTCNAVALKQLGISVDSGLNQNTVENWVNATQEITLPACENLDQVIENEIISKLC